MEPTLYSLHALGSNLHYVTSRPSPLALVLKAPQSYSYTPPHTRSKLLSPAKVFSPHFLCVFNHYLNNYILEINRYIDIHVSGYFGGEFQLTLKISNSNMLNIMYCKVFNPCTAVLFAAISHSYKAGLANVLHCFKYFSYENRTLSKF